MPEFVPLKLDKDTGTVEAVCSVRLKISNAADRDQVIMILARNGYTVRQGKFRPAGAKSSVSFVEVIDDDPAV